MIWCIAHFEVNNETNTDRRDALICNKYWRLWIVSDIIEVSYIVFYAEIRSKHR